MFLHISLQLWCLTYSCLPKHTHAHTNILNCPPLILLIIPKACVCVSVYATVCLTFLLMPQTAVVCVAPSAQTHFVISPIYVLLYWSVCACVCSIPIQSHSSRPTPHPYNARALANTSTQLQPVTMAPTQKPCSKQLTPKSVSLWPHAKRTEGNRSERCPWITPKHHLLTSSKSCLCAQ